MQIRKTKDAKTVHCNWQTQCAMQINGLRERKKPEESIIFHFYGVHRILAKLMLAHWSQLADKKQHWNTFKINKWSTAPISLWIHGIHNRIGDFIEIQKKTSRTTEIRQVAKTKTNNRKEQLKTQPKSNLQLMRR